MTKKLKPVPEDPHQGQVECETHGWSCAIEFTHDQAVTARYCFPCYSDLPEKMGLKRFA